ncbi:MAG: cytochrome c peroxidase [Pirellulales bacterium]
MPIDMNSETPYRRIMAMALRSYGVSGIFFVSGVTLILSTTSVFAEPPPGKNSANEDAIVEFGRALFFDDTLSNPKGQSCASCHAPKPDGLTPIRV